MVKKATTKKAASKKEKQLLALRPDVENRTLYEGFQCQPETVLEARGLANRPPAHGPGGAEPTRAWIEPDDQAARFPKLSALSS